MTSNWRFALARATGTSHLRHELPCQDRCVCTLLDNGSLVAALADGAGSADHAETGAEIAVSTVVATVQSATLNAETNFAELARNAALAARLAVLAHATESGIEARQFASTLLLTISTEFGAGAAQIGDGVIVVGHEGAELGWVFWPQRGEFANTTRFLTDEDAADRLEVESFSGPLSDIVMTSDGLEPLGIHYASRTVHVPFFDALLAPVFRSSASGLDTELSVALESFLGSTDVTNRADDDVSIVLATCRPNAPAP